MLDRYSKYNDLGDYYVITRIKIVWLTHHNEIGKVIVAADRFRSEAEKKGNAESLIIAGDILSRAFSANGMFKQWIENAQKTYYLQLRTFPEKKFQFMGGYGWALNQCGFHLRDTLMLDSSIYFQKQMISYTESKGGSNEQDLGELMECYQTHLLTLKRLKKYESVLEIARRGIVSNSKYFRDQNNFWYKHYRANFLASLSQAHFELGNTDSAFYYMDQADMLIPNILYISEGRAYFHAKLKQYGKATGILSQHLFGPQRIKDNASLHYLYGWAAPIYAEAGMYKESSFCYARHKAFRDSTIKLKLKTDEEYQLTNTKLLIESEKEAARVIQEKNLIETETAKKQKNIIFTSAAIIILIISVFLLIVIKRYRISQEQKKVIELQKTQVELQKLKLAEKQKEIIDSIQYAQRIQMAHLPKEQFISRILKKIRNGKADPGDQS